MVVDIRKALEESYEDRCNIFEYKNTKKEGSNFDEKKEFLAYENIPCRLSYKRIPITMNRHNAGYITLSVKIFLSPEIRVKPGSKIEVIHKGNKETYASSGISAVYDTHNEIELELYDNNA